MNMIASNMIQSVKGATITTNVVPRRMLFDVVRCPKELQLRRRHDNQHTSLSGHGMVLGRRVSDCDEEFFAFNRLEDP